MMASGRVCVAAGLVREWLKGFAVAPRLFVPAAQMPPNAPRLIIEGSGHNHLVKVLRMKAGDAFIIFDGQGNEVAAQIVGLSQRGAEVSLGSRRQLVRATADITLVQGVPKGGNMELVIQKTTELGVTRIVPVLTSRVVVRLNDEAAHGKQRRWQSIAQEAARQCGRADVPQIDLPRSLAAALATLPAASRRFALWEEGEGQPLTLCLQTLAEDERALQFLVGPEGGLAQAEMKMAAAADFVPVTLGRRILRTETAAIVAVTLAQAAAGGFV